MASIIKMKQKQLLFYAIGMGSGSYSKEQKVLNYILIYNFQEFS